MQSNAQTVDAHLDEVPSDRRPALEHLRALCREHLAGFDEDMTYGMPC